MTVLECPPQSLMCNEKEGEPWVINITLMYAQDTSYQHNYLGAGSVARRKEGVVSKGVNERSLRELLEEQDVGKFRPK